MRKQELLSWPPCQPPDWRIRENCGTTAGYHSCRKYREDLLASSQIVMSEGRDILEIDVWQDGEGLIIRYFADRKTGKHFAVIRNRVRKLALRNAISVATGGLPDAKRSVYGMSYYDKWDIDAQYAKKEDEERVQNYLGSYTLETWETVQESRRYETAQDRRRKRIEEMMEEETPPVPDDFEAWIRTKAFPREYLITREKPKTTQYTCTACRKTFRRKGKPKAITICPLCGAKVRRTGAEEEIQSRVETIYLLQERPGGGDWIERVWHAVRIWDTDGSSRIRAGEAIRILVDQGQQWGVCYYNTDDMGWWYTNRNSYRNSKGYLYPGNLKELGRNCWSEEMRHRGIEILSAKGAKFNVNNAVITGSGILEYLVKGGFWKLAEELLNHSPRMSRSSINWKGKTAQEVLRLDPARITRLKSMNGGFIALGWLQYEKTSGRKISQENLKWLEAKGVDKATDWTWKCLSYVRSPEKFANYLRKQMELLGKSPNAVISDWIDYLGMAEKQKLDLTSEMFYKPKDLKAAHDDCVRNGQAREAAARAEEIRRKFPGIEEVLKEIRDKYTYEEGRYVIRVPETVAEIIQEGRSLGHCIDTTDRYFERILRKETFLVFLRKAERKDSSWYTLEIEPGGTIRQQRTTWNNQNKDEVEATKPFIHAWQQEIGRRMSGKDRELAKASRKARIIEYEELRRKRETVWHGPLAGKLLADVLEADLIEAL